MSDLPNPEEPEFIIPLTPLGLAALGKLTATWSQIDYLLAFTIATVTRTDLGAMFVFCDNMMTGTRVNLLRKTIEKMPTEETKNFTKSLCGRLGKLVDQRNHIIHGLWGFHSPENRASCYNGRHPLTPIYSEELPDLCKRATHETRQMGLLLRMLAPQHWAAGDPPRQFFFGKDAPPDFKEEPPE